MRCAVSVSQEGNDKLCIALRIEVVARDEGGNNVRGPCVYSRPANNNQYAIIAKDTLLVMQTTTIHHVLDQIQGLVELRNHIPLLN